MPITTPSLLPGEKGYVSKKERAAQKKEVSKKERQKSHHAETTVGKIKTGGKGFRISRPITTPRREKRFTVYRYGKRVGEIIVKNKDTPDDEITLTFFRLGGIGNYKHLIQDADFQRRWIVREQELLITQTLCTLCKKKLSKTAKPNLYHLHMWKKRAQLFEQAEKIPEEVVRGNLTLEEGWEKFNDTLEEGNRYFMSLVDTVLICTSCAKQKGLVA